MYTHMCEHTMLFFFNNNDIFKNMWRIKAFENQAYIILSRIETHYKLILRFL